jgi:subtilisin family serine protease
MNKYLRFTVVLVCLSLAFSFMADSASAATGGKGYIVVYKEGIDPDAASVRLHQKYNAQVISHYHHALSGAFVRANDDQIQQIQADETVAFVELNQRWSIEAQTVGTGIQRSFAASNPNLLINGQHDYTVDADVAVIDTGIDLDHPDLNVVLAINCSLSGPFEGTCSGVKDDGNGHGSHVAGIIGARDNDFGVVGMAPGVRLWAVKVLTNQGYGTTAQIIAGIDYVAGYAEFIEVANMSLGGTGESLVMDLAISNAVAQGVTFVLAAGNSKIDVANYHPAGNPDAITVSALADFDGLPGSLGAPTCMTDIDDTLAYFSNFGAGVNIAAPGACIYSTYKDGAYKTSSGTSMAAPHVTGAAALLASGSSQLTPDEIKTILTSNGNYNWVDDAPDGIKEPLLDVSNATVFNPAMLPTTFPISLTAYGYKVSGYQATDLTWSGAFTASVDIYRDGAFMLNTENDGFYYDYTGILGEGIHTYRVCEENSITVCSATVMVVY